MITLEKLSVAEAYRLDDEEPIRLRLDDEISLIITTFAAHSDVRGVFVVDEMNRFAGVITRTDLLDWARVKLGAVLFGPRVDMEKSIRIATLVHASKIGDILRPETSKIAVLGSDRLARAARLMIEANLIVLPVIDEGQQIIGSLTLSELLNAALTTTEDDQ